MKLVVKSSVLVFLFISPLLLGAERTPIKEYALDEHTVYTIPVSLERVTTISFPGPISAIDATQVTTDTKIPASFQIAHTKGSSFFSVKALVKRAATNVNLRWNRKTYVLELVESPDPLFSVIFQIGDEQPSNPKAVRVTPHRLLALLDKTKAYPLLKAHHPETVGQVEYRPYGDKPKVMDYKDFEILLEEVFRFNPEDTLVFRIVLRNKTDRALSYQPDGFSLRVGERTYFPSIADASGTMPPRSETPAYFAITGTPNGGRNDLSLKNDFAVVLEVPPASKEELKEKPEDDEPRMP